MSLSSPKISFDDRLLAIEEEFRQRKFHVALKELANLSEAGFKGKEHELGLYLSLRTDGHLYESNYKKALQDGLRAARLLADFPLNKRYGRIQLVLSKAYSAVGDLKNAEMRARDALAAYRRASEKLGQIDSLNELARVAYFRCNYAEAVAFLEDALSMVTDNQRKVAQLTGNIGRIRINTGQWQQAEKELAETLEYDYQASEEISQAINLLSLGALQMRQRKLILAGRTLDKSLEIISRLGLKREKVIYLEFAGELAYEKGDLYKAKAILSNAYEKGMMMAPGSALVSQSARRLAEVELGLDNIDDAMKYGQKGLELSLKLGEKLEVGLSRRVIAEVFAAKADFDEAIEYINSAAEVVKELGEPLETARTLLVAAEIMIASGQGSHSNIAPLYEQAYRLF